MSAKIGSGSGSAMLLYVLAFIVHVLQPLTHKREGGREVGASVAWHEVATRSSDLVRYSPEFLRRLLLLMMMTPSDQANDETRLPSSAICRLLSLPGWLVGPWVRSPTEVSHPPLSSRSISYRFYCRQAEKERECVENA